MTWWQMALLVAGGLFLLYFSWAVMCEIFFITKQKHNAPTDEKRG